MDKICSFFGHRKIVNKKEVQAKLILLLEDLIKKGFTVFLFGGLGEFDELCHKTITYIKQKNPQIKRVYCLIDEKHLVERKRVKYIKREDYEEFVYFSLSYDYWYTRIYYRNCEMIKKSDFIIFYAEERDDSGAYKAFKYAIKCKKQYVNIFNNDKNTGAGTR